MSKTDYTLPDIHADYVATKKEIDYDLFRSICEDFNKRVMEEIIYNGRAMNMGSYLSTMEVVRIERDYSKPVINWKASNKRKEEIIAEGGTPYSKDNPDGEKWFVYYTDKYYLKFHWHKTKCKVKNKTVYRFTPTRGKVGNKRKLKDHLKDDDLAYLKYRQI